MAGDLNDSACYQAIAAKLADVDKQHQTAGNVLFYLSTQPSYYSSVVQQLGQHGLNRGSGGRRVIIEKPFGHDLASARQLNSEIHTVFNESQIYRIDHYLGKETVQNILAFRFGNGIFEPLWNRGYVNSVQITAAESIGVEGRGAYYQEAGALRDMIQNHLMQVMATVAMEPPTVYDADRVRDERAKLLHAIQSSSLMKCRCARWPASMVPPTSAVARRCLGFLRGTRRQSCCPDRHLLLPSRSTSTTGAGPACRSTSAPANACPSCTG